MPVLSAQLDKVESEDDRIHETDREPIKQFLEAEQGRKADSTVAQYAVNLRTLSRRSPVPLIEASPDDMQSLLDDLASGNHPDVKDDGIQVQPHASALSRFGSYHDRAFEYSEFEFEPSRGRDLSPDDLLYKEDVDALLDACGMDVRYKALITWGLATGQRLDAIRTVRIEHIEWDGPAGDITLNVEEGALKGASGSVPMFWAKHYIREWLEVHPFPDDPEAALFVPDPRINGNMGADVSRDPMAQSTIRHKLNTLQERSGIDKNLYPHLLRHCAATRMALEGLPEQQIKSIMNWSGDSSQFDTYVTLANKLRNDSIRESMGLPTSDTEKVILGKPTLKGCGSCGEEYPPKMDVCPTCSTALTEDGSEIDDTVRESYREIDDADTLEKVQLLDELLQDGEVRQLLSERMETDTQRVE